MFSVEFFNKCNITLPAGSLQEVCQRYQGKVMLAKPGYNTSCGVHLTKRLHVRPLKASLGVSLRCSKGTTLVKNVSAEDSTKNHPKEDSSGLYYSGQLMSKEELIALRESAVRTSLLKKLSDANLHGRLLQRQILEKENALLDCKSVLKAMESEIQVLIKFAQEVASEGIKPGTRKINGKYIQSHLAIKLEEIQQRLLVQAQNIEATCFRDVPLVWYGVAEDVKFMGSFDGWNQGIQLSPEVTGAFTKFSATLKLRPGRYQTKFLIDGDWQVSPNLPLVGEEPTVNNLLIVE